MNVKICLFLTFFTCLTSQVAAQNKLKSRHQNGFRTSFGCAVHGKKGRLCKPKKPLPQLPKPLSILSKSYFEIGATLGPSFLLGDFGGNWGDGRSTIKDLDILSTRYVVGIFSRWHFVHTSYVEFGYSRLRLQSNDNNAPRKNSRFRRDSTANVILHELNCNAFLFGFEARKFTVHVGSGGFLYSYSGSSGRNGSTARSEFSRMGVGWAVSLQVRWKGFSFGLTHRSVFHDGLDGHKAHENDAYGTVSIRYLHKI